MHASEAASYTRVQYQRRRQCYLCNADGRRPSTCPSSHNLEVTTWRDKKTDGYCVALTKPYREHYGALVQTLTDQGITCDTRRQEKGFIFVPTSMQGRAEAFLRDAEIGHHLYTDWI